LAGTAIAACLALAAHAQTTPTLLDIGADPPTPGPDDISQLTTGADTADGLNYYFDNGTPPGQTFTTGSNPNGYTLTSLTISTADNAGSLPAAGQAYILRLFSVSGSNATLIATYTSQADFIFTDNDWLQMTNLGATLAANSQYGYSFARTSAGWERLGNVSGNPYVGGELALIPSAGGAITLGASHDFDAAFVVGLTPVTVLTVNPPTIAPSVAVVVGTTATISVTAAGPSPYHYQWQTDGGSGGLLTNIPSATGASLVVDTTGYALGPYQYDVIVTNSTSSVTSDVVTLAVTAPPAAAALTDLGTTAAPEPNDIIQYVGGGDRDGLNYYDDNGANHDGWAGQTFTTGTNSQGYYLTSVSFQTGGGTVSGVNVVQPYHLYLYQVNASSAILMAHYTNGAFSFADGDWLKWSGFNLTLKPNKSYAYAFGRDSTGTGWEALAVSPTNSDLYAGGQMCLIPAAGGPMTFGTTGLSDAVFDVGLLPVGVGPDPHPFGGAISVAPSRTVSAGTQVTLGQAATGAAPLHFQWRTDGGSGTLTNIPGATDTNLVVNTTGWRPATYQFDFIVTNSFGSSSGAVTSVAVIYTNATAVISDVGSTTPPPVATDLAQTTPASGANNPDGMNYYFDNGSPPGQTFTTGSNPNGYTLTSLAIKLADNAGGLPANGQYYMLRIYSVSGSTATSYATYTSQDNFTYTSSDWLRWSGFALPLPANTTMAYTLGRSSTGSGWENLSNVAGNPYAGGEVVLIPPSGGPIVFGSSHDYDGAFVIGLALPGRPYVAPPVFSPSSTVYAQTPVTVTAPVTGTGPFTYQWMTDGGSGGALTNIPGALGGTLLLNTTGLDNLTVAYALAAGNASGVTVGEASYLTVQPASTPVVLVDTTPSSPFRLAGGSVTFAASFEGTLPFRYQWQGDKGTGPASIVGQTNATLILTNLAVTDTGSYSLVVSNSLGAVNSAFSYLTVLPAPPTNTYDRALLSYGPLAYWEFNEPALSATAYDYVSGFDGAYQPTSFSGVPGLPVSLGGLPTGDFALQCVYGYTNSGVTLPALNFPATNTITWTAWIYPSSTNASSTTYTQAAWTGIITTRSSTYASGVNYNDQGMLGYTWNQNNANTYNFVSQLVIPNNRWSFVAVALSPSNAALYLINAGGFQMTNNPIAHDAETWNGASTIGYDAIGGATPFARNFNGTIDDVAVFTHTLSTADIQNLYAAKPYSPSVTLNIQRYGTSQIELQWSQGTLLEATSLSGPWTTNNATSPAFLTPSAPQKFYRLRMQ
jgi:hypothetical protein